MKTYVAIVRDHSVSMRRLANGAREDFNLSVQSIKDTVMPGDQALISVVECGVGPLAETRVVARFTPSYEFPMLNSYHTTGMATPLLDSVGAAIHELSNVYDRDSLGTAFLVMVITDGEENNSKIWNASKLAHEIRRLQNTDRWTFVFRGPIGSREQFESLGVQPGNIMEWEQSDLGLHTSTLSQSRGINDYFVARSAGKTSVNTFYVNTTNVTEAAIKAAQQHHTVTNVRNKFKSYNVYNYGSDITIKSFFEKLNGYYKPGDGYYQLTKYEKDISDRKEILIRNKKTNDIYTGTDARRMLSLPETGYIRLAPGNFATYDVFVQSTSSNRKLVPGTEVLYRVA